MVVEIEMLEKMAVEKMAVTGIEEGGALAIQPLPFLCIYNEKNTSQFESRHT